MLWVLWPSGRAAPEKRAHRSFHCWRPGSGLVGGEAAHAEDGAWRSAAVPASALRLPGGQKRRREEEGAGCSAHLHDAPGLRQDEQGHREAEGTDGGGAPAVSAAGGGADCSPFAVALQPASKDQVVAMLEKARAVMPAKPAAPAKSGGVKGPAEPSRAASGLWAALKP